MIQSYKIAVIGAGLMGRVITMRLIQEGFLDVTVFEKDHELNSTSPANIAAGMLAGLSECVTGGEIIYNIGKSSIYLWKEYLESLNSTHLINIKGTILISHPQFQNEITHYFKKINSITKLENYYQVLNKSELNKIEPELNFNCGYYLAEEGMLNAKEVMLVLKKSISKNVKWNTNFQNINSNGYLTINGLESKFDLVIDCRGMGAKELFLNLREVRGEIIRVHAPDVNIKRPVRFFHPRHNIYVVPYENNYYAIGATEIEANDYSPVSVRSTLELLTSAYSIHSGFAEARVLSMDSSCRPTLSGNHPIIYQTNKLIAINGLYRHGFLLAPGIAEEVIGYIKYGNKKFINLWG